MCSTQYLFLYLYVESLGARETEFTKSESKYVCVFIYWLYVILYKFIYLWFMIYAMHLKMEAFYILWLGVFCLCALCIRYFRVFVLETVKLKWVKWVKFKRNHLGIYHHHHIGYESNFTRWVILIISCYKPFWNPSPKRFCGWDFSLNSVGYECNSEWNKFVDCKIAAVVLFFSCVVRTFEFNIL